MLGFLERTFLDEMLNRRKIFLWNPMLFILFVKLLISAIFLWSCLCIELLKKKCLSVASFIFRANYLSSFLPSHIVIWGVRAWLICAMALVLSFFFIICERCCHLVRFCDISIHLHLAVMAGVAPEGSQFDARQFDSKMNDL